LILLLNSAIPLSWELRLAKFERVLSLRGVAIPSAETLQMALTHRSAGKANYERMEFLGDSLVNMVCAELLFKTQLSASEGELTRLRSNLVDEASLAAFARELKLGDYLILGGGELKSGGHRRDSILADTFEALCAAIYLDHGLAAMRALLEPLLLAALPIALEKAQSKDGKTQLQEYLQDKGRILPLYTLLETFGLEHNREFLVRCEISATDKFQAMESSGRGSSLRRAEQAAASAMLQTLKTSVALKIADRKNTHPQTNSPEIQP
jgi:ribonuclease-3